MKNIFKIKNLVFATTLIFVCSYNVSAQTYPITYNNDSGTDWDNFLVNKDKSLNTARVKLMTNAEPNGTSILENNNREFNISLSNGGAGDPGQKLFTIIQNTNSGDQFQGIVRGNVGIGEFNPKEKLHVNGNIRFENNGNGVKWANHSKIYDDGDLKILTDDNMYFGKLNGDGTPGNCAIYANLNTGNVGIGGVTNPTQKLEVNGDAKIGNALIYASGSNGFGIIHKNMYDSSVRNYTLFGSFDGSHTYINKKDTGTGYIGFSVGAVNKAVILNNGNMGIGTNTPSSKLAVNGTVTALNYAVTAAMAADYVFEPDYKLKTLSETDTYIKANKHLPAFKSAKHYEANGYTMVEMNIALEQTVEELTLHAIAQEKEMNTLKDELAEIKALLLAKK
jgi:hypothetical protein